MNGKVVALSNHTFVRFCIVGGIATIVNYAIFLILYWLGIFYLAAAAGGYVSGVAFGYVLNKRFAFRSTSKHYKREVPLYLSVYAASLVLGLLILNALVHLGLHPIIANVLTIVVTTVTNFSGMRFLVFRQ